MADFIKKRNLEINAFKYYGIVDVKEQTFEELTRKIWVKIFSTTEILDPIEDIE